MITNSSIIHLLCSSRTEYDKSDAVKAYFKSAWNAWYAEGNIRPLAPSAESPDDRPVPLPTDLPGKAHSAGSSYLPLAGFTVEDETVDVAALLFEQGSLVCLLVRLTLPQTMNDMLRIGEQLHVWMNRIGDPPGKIAGESFIITIVNAQAKFEPDELGQIFATPDDKKKSPPDTPHSDSATSWTSAWYETADKVTIWENSAYSAKTRRRALVVTAPPTSEAQLEALTWAAVSGAAPLVRYLLHTHVIAYEASSRGARVDIIKQRIDEDLAALNSLMAPRRWTRTEIAKLQKARDALRRIRSERVDEVVAQLRELAITIKTAGELAGRDLPHPVRVGAERTFAVRDAELYKELTLVVDTDLKRLSALVERTSAADRWASERLSEYVQQMTERRGILQTALLAAIVTALASSQALDYKISVTGALQLPVIVCLVALTVALPLLFLRPWYLPTNEVHSRSERMAAAVLGAALLWLGAVVLMSPDRRTVGEVALESGLACAGALIGYGLTWVLDRRGRQ